MIICSKTYALQDFDWDKGSRVLTAEASTLTQGGKVPLFGLVYDDSEDMGFNVYSRITNREITFVVTSTDRDANGDVAGWRLEPILVSEDGLPVWSRGLRVLVIND